ncbi:MAG: SDR family oxidoreductase [Clostridiales bacterium]|nr:SDR family oxidoreductase [Clostridiales bacterium]
MGMFDFTGRVAVVTGGTAGLGRGMAIALARQNCDLAILARRTDVLERTAEEIRTLGVRCLPVQCDITEDESVANAVKTIMNEYGRVDILVNNAGAGGPPTPTVELEMTAYKKLIELNLTSTFRVIKAFVPSMLEAGYGRIVNVASVLGMVGHLEVALAGYESAKGGVINLTRGLAAEFATRGITVNAISPGTFPSECNDPAFMTMNMPFVRRTTPMQRTGTPTDLNTVGDMDAAIVFLASEEARYVTGVILPVDGGWTCC